MEIEFKFQIPPDRLAALQAAVRGPGSTRTHLQARYFDTEVSSLSAQGIALRLRKEGRRWVQTAKALGDGPVQRLEHNVDLGPQRKDLPFTARVERHAGTPVGQRLAQVLATDDAPLIEVYGTDIWRLARVVAHGRSHIELALDTGVVMAPAHEGGAPRRAAVCELELELLEGDVSDLAALAADWATRHGLWLSTMTKSERGLRLARGQGGVPAVKSTPPRFAGRPRTVGGPALQRSVVVACLAQILPNATEIAGGSEDADQIHQLRVGVRRLRTALRELAMLGPGFDPAWEPALAQAFKALGARRDQQQMALNLLPRLQAAGAPDLVLPAPPDASPGAAITPMEAVRAPAFQAAVVGLTGFAAADATPDGCSPSETRRHLRKRLRRLFRRIRDEGHDFARLPPERQHALRKRLKRLRYLAEFVGPLFDAKAAEAFTRSLAPVQDALGSYQDEATAHALFLAAAPREPRAWFAVGWLSAHLSEAARGGEEALHTLRALQPFWRSGKASD